MIQSKKLFAAPAVLAALSLTAMPASAAELPQSGAPSAFAADMAWQPTVPGADDYRPWRHRRDRDRVDVGGVIAGVLLIGGIAAVASAATRNARRTDYRAPPPPPYPDRGADYASAAVRTCLDAVERGDRAADNLIVDRRGYGFTVRGRLDAGTGFTCDVGGDGRIMGIAYDGAGDRGAYAPPPPPPYGMSEQQRAYDASRTGGDADEAAPAYPDVAPDGAVQPGQGIDTRPEYPGDLPQNRTGAEASRSAAPAQPGEDQDDGDLDPGRMGPGTDSSTGQ